MLGLAWFFFRTSPLSYSPLPILPRTPQHEPGVVLHWWPCYGSQHDMHVLAHIAAIRLQSIGLRQLDFGPQFENGQEVGVHDWPIQGRMANADASCIVMEELSNLA